MAKVIQKIQENLLFVKQYAFKTKATGAILPSSGFLADKMLNDIDFALASVIVEYGPGTGVFTAKLLARRQIGAKIICIENNVDFYNTLQAKYGQETDFYLFCGSAEHVSKYLKEAAVNKVDVIVSGLPFLSLPRALSEVILAETKRIIGTTGVFVTFQYTLVNKPFFARFFANIKITRELRNVPPAYVFSCRN